MKYSFLLLLSCVFFFSCMKIKPKSSDPAPPAKLVVISQYSTPTWQVEDYQSFNSYGVRFQFGEDWPQAVIVEVVGAAPAVTTSSLQELGIKRSLTVALKSPGQRTEFRFYSASATEKRELARVHIDEPRDLFIEGLQTMDGQDLQLSAKKIYFQKAILRSFPEGQKAPRGVRGRNGGAITIIADEIEGDLQIDPRGEDGGDGLDGSDPGPELKGKAGAPGRHGVIGEIRVISPKDFGPSELVTLKSQPTAGENGETGRVGYPGKTGEDGGHSSKIKIIAKNRENFRVEVKRIFSKGGQGGRGGLGGEGGEPGSPGLCFEGYNPKRDDFVKRLENCQMPNPAQKGMRGQEGSSGANGRDGQAFELCLESLKEKCDQGKFF